MRRQPKAFVESTAVIAILCVLGWLALRRKYIEAAKRQLSTNGNDGVALKRWQTGQIISFALSEAVAMYGLNLRYAGLAFSGAAWFYVAGLLLMLSSFPRSPVTNE